jgi:hypothetical protein
VAALTIVLTASSARRPICLLVDESRMPRTWTLSGFEITCPARPAVTCPKRERRYPTEP